MKFFEIDQNILSLARPFEVIFPKAITIAKNSSFSKETVNYALTSFVCRGADGAVYEGYDTKNPKDLLIFKCYAGGFYWQLGYDTAKRIFDTEVWVLQRLSRLVNADRENLLSVQPKIEGISLEAYLSIVGLNNNINKSHTQIKDEYLNLPGEFRKKWNLIHGNVRPSNVIIDSLGNMHLIDFGRSRTISTDERQRYFEEMVDDNLARKAIGSSYDYDWTSFSSYEKWLRYCF